MMIEPEGRTFDAWIAEHVFRLKRTVRLRGTTTRVIIYSDNPYFQDGIREDDILRYCQPLPYTTDLAAAWTIVESFRRGRADRAACCIELTVTDHIQRADCHCRIYGPNTQESEAWANTMPLAICLAAYHGLVKQATRG